MEKKYVSPSVESVGSEVTTQSVAVAAVPAAVMVALVWDLAVAVNYAGAVNVAVAVNVASKVNAVT